MTRKEEFLNSGQPESFWNILGTALNEEVFERRDVEVSNNILYIGKFLKFELTSFKDNLVTGVIHYENRTFDIINKYRVSDVANALYYAVERNVDATFREIVNSFLVKMRRKERLVCRYYSDSHVKIVKTKLNRDVIVEMEIKSETSFTSLSEVITMFNFVDVV